MEKYGNISYASTAEAKDHSEGGNIIGVPLAGLRIVMSTM